MITNPKKLREFENELIRKTKPNYKKNLAIVEAMYEEYRKLGRKDLDPLEGIEIDIRVARVVNSV